MAIAARTLRATPNRAPAVRSRMHSTDGARVMVKRTAAVAHLVQKPQLALVPRRRRTARLIAAVCAPVFALMLGAAAFQTQLASRQVRLDAVDRDIREAYNQYDTMRRERAELRSPGRLEIEAAAIGMVPASQTQFLALDPSVIAAVQRSGIGTGSDSSDIGEEFQQYADVKAQSGGSP
ncbi:hypothetical protein BH10ACT2_BH10ACT2_13180 [soil metagenome]